MALGPHLLILLALVGPPDPLAGPMADARQDQLLAWVCDVSLGTEYGGSGAVVSRWVNSPTLEMVGANAEQRQMVTEIVKHVNETLALTPIKQIRVLSSARAGSANICVYFAPLKDFPTIAERHGFKYQGDSVAYNWTFWDGQFRFTRAYILIAPDEFEDATLRHNTLESITKVLGFNNNSATYKDSIFYRKESDYGDAKELAHKDQVLIWLIYNYVEPGSGWAQVRDAYARRWPKEYR